MRDILFRGKRIDSGWWETGHYSNYHSSATGKLLHFINGFEYEVYPDTVGQYTGLTDKNGKRIFEGDIVHYIQHRYESIGVVAFADGAFGVKFTDGTSAMYLCYAADYCEVIGNIHDDPELLEGGQ